jgi:hypothetical protein
MNTGAFFLLTEKKHITYSSLLPDFIPLGYRVEAWSFFLGEISGEDLSHHPRRYRIRQKLPSPPVGLPSLLSRVMKREEFPRALFPDR